MFGERPIQKSDSVHSPFHTTQWSLVVEAGEDDSAVASVALEKLCRAYWYPIYAEIRRRNHSPHDAQDLTQEFFACLLRRQSFATARRERGRFRSFLLGALNYFLSDHRDRQNAAKRGGGQRLLSLDELEAEPRYQEEPVTNQTPEKIFDQRWAVALMELALGRLATEFDRAGKAAIFAEIKPFLAVETSESGYAEPARRLGMRPAAIAVAVHRLRFRYRDLIRAEVTETLANPADAEDELKHLLDFF